MIFRDGARRALQGPVSRPLPATARADGKLSQTGHETRQNAFKPQNTISMNEMRICGPGLSRKLAELGYDGPAAECWVAEPRHEPRAEARAAGDYSGLAPGSEVVRAPRLDDAAYWLEDNFWIMAVIEPFIYNGAIYNCMARLYSPFLFEAMPGHMEGIEVLGADGMHFLDRAGALEAAVGKAADLALENAARYGEMKGGAHAKP